MASSKKPTKRTTTPRRRAASVDARIEKLTAEKEASEDEAFALTHRVATLEGRERDLNELIIGHRERIAALDAEREALGREVKSERQRSAKLERREAKLTEQLVNARELIVSLEAKRDELVDGQRNRSAAHERELAEALSHVAALEAKRDEFTEELAGERERSAELRRRESDLAGRISVHQDRISALQEELDEHRERTAELEKRNVELSSELSARSERVATLEAEHETLDRDLERERRDGAELRERERTLQERAVILHEQVARLEAHEDVLRRSLAEEKDRRFTLGSREAKLEQQLGSAREKIAALEATREELQGASKERERELRARVETSQEEVARLEGEREAVQRALDEELGKAATLHDERAAEAESAQERITTLETERDELQRSLETVRSEITRIEGQLTGLAVERDRLQSERERLKSRLEQLQSSRAYRVMRLSWRFRAAIKRPFRRSARPALDKGRGTAEAAQPRGERTPALGAGEAKPGPAQKSGVKPAMPKPRMRTAAATPPPPTQGPESPAAEPEQAPPAPAPEPAQPASSVDEERERWLGKPQSPPADVGELRVAAVLDEMSAACFAPDCDLLRFESEGWQDALQAHEPHLLLVESTWQGNSGSWQYQVASYTHPDYIGLPNLKALVAWCRERDIPTVFWNKEDPVHFERFAEAAALFDYVFTSDSNCIERYAELERDTDGPIDALQFAAQPRIHNPVGAPAARSGSPVFAGAYYRDRHISRQESLEMLLDAAMPFGLEIYDRRFGSEDQAFGFPERFKDRVQGRLSYDEMIEAYKSHRIFLNVNSVTDSPTMFSRRVFELLACGTAVVSTEGLGVERTLGDLVPVVTTPEKATEALTKLEDEDYRRQLALRGRREVIGRHTYRHRLAEIASTLGFKVAAYSGEEVAALALVDDVDQARRFREVVSSISAQKTPPVELLVGTHTSVAGDLQELSDGGRGIRVRVVQQDPDNGRTQRYRELAALASSPWLAILHPAHTYGEHHITDLVLSTRFTDADVIGSASFETSEGAGAVDRSLEHRFVDFVHPHSVLVRRELVARRGWPDQIPGADEELRRWFRDGVRLYSGDAGSFHAAAAVGLPGRAAQATAEQGPER